MWAQSMNNNHNAVLEGTGDYYQDYGRSVRCMKDQTAAEKKGQEEAKKKKAAARARTP